MPAKNQVSGVIKSFKQFWKSQSKKRKIIVLSVLGAIIILAVVLATVMHKEPYTALYTGLDQSEAVEILSELKNMDVDASMSSDGNIMVPDKQANDLRMNLATKGYPKSTFSYSIWTDNVNMFTTDSQQRETIKMQLQERLQATIQTLDGVKTAIVTLDIPETSNNVLSTNSKQATASVVLHLEDGSTLSAAQVKGITHIVAMSISGLDENNVSITDGTGKLLSSAEVEVDGMVLETQHLKFEKDFEDAIKQNILDLLTPSYGEDNVRVSVNANFDFDKKVSENTQYTPSHEDGSGMIDNKDEYSASGDNTSQGDIVGVTPNADGTYPTDNGTDLGGSWQESKTSTSYLVNTLKEQTEKQGYYVDKVFVSVMVYKDFLGNEERQSIMNSVITAAGTQADCVSVESLPKYSENSENNTDNPTTTNPAAPVGKINLAKLIIYGGICVIVILIGLIVLSIIRHKKKKKKKLAMLAEQERIRQEKEAEEIQKITDVPETKEAAIRREIGEFAQDSPEAAAQLLKSWMREDGDKH